MLRLGGRLIAIAVLCLWVFVPMLDLTPVDTDFVSEPTSITNYDADFTIDDDGDLRAVEKITVNFPQYESRHGIFRFFDVRDQNEPTARRIPRDVTVTMDGEDEDFEELTEKRGRYRTLKIGEACCTVSPGEHTYEISYTIDGVLTEGSSGHPALLEPDPRRLAPAHRPGAPGGAPAHRCRGRAVRGRRRIHERLLGER